MCCLAERTPTERGLPQMIGRRASPIDEEDILADLGQKINSVTPSDSGPTRRVSRTHSR